MTKSVAETQMASKSRCFAVDTASILTKKPFDGITI